MRGSLSTIGEPSGEEIEREREREREPPRLFEEKKSEKPKPAAQRRKSKASENTPPNHRDASRPLFPALQLHDFPRFFRSLFALQAHHDGQLLSAAAKIRRSSRRCVGRGDDERGDDGERLKKRFFVPCARRFQPRTLSLSRTLLPAPALPSSKHTTGEPPN